MEMALALAILVLFFSGILGINGVLQARFDLSMRAYNAARAVSFQTLRTGNFDPNDCGALTNATSIKDFLSVWFNVTDLPPESEVTRSVTIEQPLGEDMGEVDSEKSVSPDIPYAGPTDTFTLETAPVLIRVRLTSNRGFFNQFSSLMPILPNPVGEAVFPLQCTFPVASPPPNAQTVW